MFSCISNITHQSILYKTIWRLNKIDTLLEELSSEINALSTMIRRRKDQEQKSERIVVEKVNTPKDNEGKKKKTAKDFFMLIITVFTFITAITNIEKIVSVLSKIISGIYLIFEHEEITPEVRMFIFILV